MRGVQLNLHYLVAARPKRPQPQHFGIGDEAETGVSIQQWKLEANLEQENERCRCEIERSPDLASMAIASSSSSSSLNGECVCSAICEATSSALRTITANPRSRLRAATSSDPQLEAFEDEPIGPTVS
ncbi:hypothetical protein NL676_030366 [Syzygium grande]|nr:hypothetical protein NL676_030366 [Syzygium grande]